ncbi:site-specific integrase [Fictibacillus terranigra]|uniref:Site-specific integrase n=1 Tax=Fictibacillus terranigra TaxID=3058424 RepID=A0ABT8E6V9_9BACL|nr:site-specific integrase [Fictibacillus sp. CENA-BCM004]MDN4073642.1 site-specific integrase [Fictibacillus sp. CENA-BCM004]
MAGEFTVQPIRDKKHIERIKKALHGRDRLLFILGINFGLRISDLLTLKVKDLRGKRYLTIIESKTGKQRRIDFSDSVIREVKTLEGSPEDYVFASREGVNKPISRQQAWNIINAAVERAGLTEKIGKLGTHSLRKTFGYHAYNSGKGVDLSLLMEVFGHSSQKITLRYIGIQADDISKVYKSLSL